MLDLVRAHGAAVGARGDDRLRELGDGDRALDLTPQAALHVHLPQVADPDRLRADARL